MRFGWLPDSGTAIHGFMGSTVEWLRRFKIPNTVVAYWVEWAPRLWQGLGPWVSQHHLPLRHAWLCAWTCATISIGDDLGLAKIFHEKSSASRLPLGEGIYNRATKQLSASILSLVTLWWLWKYPGLEYGMALGLVFACTQHREGSGLITA